MDFFFKHSRPGNAPRSPNWAVVLSRMRRWYGVTGEGRFGKMIQPKVTTATTSMHLRVVIF